MDPDKLTDSEVSQLISEIKEFLDHPAFNAPAFGKYKQEENLSDNINGITYKLHIYRGSLESKYSMHIRFLSNNIHLVRLCIHGSVHHNYDGNVSGNHIHIYKLHNGEVLDYAYPLDQTPFNKSDDLAKSMDKFFKYVNIKS
ncbi:DUF6978 family protein [Levilactobacillus andaensis]|uniref:DUF6978 family protein n=1 Tax=Levilactobacillus andaensis TaxID=2799570 RepID=UPI001943BAF9|nr:hypothetical protein [Levilactobacillus andaensis]